MKRIVKANELRPGMRRVATATITETTQTQDGQVILTWSDGQTQRLTSDANLEVEE